MQTKPLNSQYNHLQENLEYLKLTKMKEQLDGILDKLHKKEIAFIEALKLLTDQEVERKKINSINYTIKMAGFPQLKELKDFDFEFQPGIDKRQLYDLATLNFLENCENIVFLGSCGVGKTYLATALGIEAAKHGHSAYFIKANDLFGKLRKAQSENRLSHMLKTYKRYRVLIIDELGFLPVTKGDDRLLFQLLDQRYETRSTIITSNVQFSDWGELFEDPRITNAILDRLLHHSHVITILGDSYRLKDVYSVTEDDCDLLKKN